MSEKYYLTIDVIGKEIGKCLRKNCPVNSRYYGGGPREFRLNWSHDLGRFPLPSPEDVKKYLKRMRSGFTLQPEMEIIFMEFKNPSEAVIKISYEMNKKETAEEAKKRVRYTIAELFYPFAEKPCYFDENAPGHHDCFMFE